MKKYLMMASIVACLGIAACGGNTDNNSSASDTAQTAASAGSSAVSDEIAKNPDYQKGLDLIAKNDCLTCHQISTTNTGPAYRDVANKYDNSDATISTLAAKIIKGGSGNWGTVPMTPHADLSVDDAKQMVKYILLLKTK